MATLQAHSADVISPAVQNLCVAGPMAQSQKELSDLISSTLQLTVSRCTMMLSVSNNNNNNTTFV